MKGYLLYYQQDTLFAAPMDADRLELTGAGVASCLRSVKRK